MQRALQRSTRAEIGPMRLGKARMVDEVGLQRHHHRGLALARMHDALLVVEHLLRRLMPDHAVGRGGDGGCELTCELCRQRIERAPVARILTIMCSIRTKRPHSYI